MEVIEQIRGIRNPLFKGFNLLQEALDQARFKLGPNFYVTPCLRNFQEPLNYKVARDEQNKILFCEHCEVMSRTIKHLNENTSALIKEKTQLIERVRELEKVIKHKDNHINYLLCNPNSIIDINADTRGESSRPILGGNLPKTSLAQTVASKDKTNLLMAATFPKSRRIAREVADKTSPSPSQTVEGKDLPRPFMGDAFPKSMVRTVEEESKGKNKEGRKLPKSIIGGKKSKNKKKEKSKNNEKLDYLVNLLLLNSFSQKKDSNQDHLAYQHQEQIKKEIGESSSKKSRKDGEQSDLS